MVVIVLVCFLLISIQEQCAPETTHGARTDSHVSWVSVTLDNASLEQRAHFPVGKGRRYLWAGPMSIGVLESQPCCPGQEHPQYLVQVRSPKNWMKSLAILIRTLNGET